MVLLDPLWGNQDSLCPSVFGVIASSLSNGFTDHSIVFLQVKPNFGNRSYRSLCRACARGCSWAKSGSCLRVDCLACVCPHVACDVMVHLIWVAFVSVATQTNPLDLWDDMVLRDIRDRKRLVEEEMDLFGLEFINSDFCGLEWCYSSTRNDCLDRLPEMYKMTTSPTV